MIIQGTSKKVIKEHIRDCTGDVYRGYQRGIVEV